MFNKLLFPIFSFVSVGGVAVGFSKYNNNSAVPVDSLLDESKNQSGTKIKTIVKETEKEEKAAKYFYSAVNVDRTISNSMNIVCEQALPFINPKTRFTCALFDISGSKDSTTVITEIQQKINTEMITLSAVTTAQNNRYYLLRTETSINNNIEKIAIYSTANKELGTIDLETDWEKNIQYQAKQ